MRNRNALALAGLAILSIAGCAGVEVHSDWDRAVDFGRFETYLWAPSNPGAGERDADTIHSGDKSLLDRRIRRLVDEEMAAKGFRLTTSGDADFLLVYHASTKKRVEIWSSPYRRWYGGPRANSWREGTLLIEVVDLSQKSVVWQGWGTAPLGSPEKSEDDMRKVISNILKRFPPPTE